MIVRPVSTVTGSSATSDARRHGAASGSTATT